MTKLRWRGGGVALFEYRFVNPTTGRTNRKIGRAYDEEELRAALATENIVPTSVEVLPPDMATDAQIRLLIQKGAAIPDDLTKEEASDMIDGIISKGGVASAGDFAIAKALKVEVTKYASKRAIYAAIFYTMRDRDAVAFGTWFAYRVFRNEFDRGQSGAQDPLDGRFRAIGHAIANDRRLNDSFKRLVSESTVHFRWFGALRLPDGVESIGDGNRGAAYKFAVQSLFEAGMIAHAEPRGRRVLATQRPSCGKPKRAEVDLRGHIIAFFTAVAIALVLWLT